MTSASDITIKPPNDFVGDEASRGRVSGAEETIGPHASGQGKINRAEEHLPPPTGRDRPPVGVAPGTRVAVRRHLPSDILSARENEPRQPLPPRRINRTPSPLPPAPDSRTVIDTDPYAERASAGDTLGGVTSADVDRSLGHPAIGMSSAEMHHDGKPHRKRSMQGKDQYGSHAIPREVETRE